MSDGDAAVIIQTHQRLNDVNQNDVVRNLARVALLVVRVFHDHSITAEPCCALRVLNVPNNAISC